MNFDVTPYCANSSPSSKVIITHSAAAFHEQVELSVCYRLSKA